MSFLTIIDRKTIARKDTKTYSLVLKRDSSPITLTGLDVYLSCKNRYDGDLIFDKKCTNTNDSEGLAQVTLSSVDTATVCKNAIAEVILISGTNQETLGQFYIDFVKDIKIS